MDRLRSFTANALSRAEGDAEGVIPAVLSSSETARDGFRIDQSGWQLDNFRKNPVTLFNHDDGMRNLPIGLWRDVEVNEDGNLAGVSHLDMEDDFARQVAGKVARGLINATSVRWIPLEHKIERVKRHESEAEQNIIVFTRSELLEASLVVLPADPRAVILRSDGAHEFTVAEFVGEPEPEKRRVDTPRSHIASLALHDVADTARALIEARSGGVFTPEEQEAAARLYGAIADRVRGADLPSSARDDLAAALDELIPLVRDLIVTAEQARTAAAETRVLERALFAATGKTPAQLRRMG